MFKPIDIAEERATLLLKDTIEQLVDDWGAERVIDWLEKIIDELKNV